jgi:hypothetical protein
MRVGKIPAAAIILIVFVLASYTLNHIYPGLYSMDSPFMEGAFCGAMFVYLLYYLSIWINARNTEQE